MAYSFVGVFSVLVILFSSAYAFTELCSVSNTASILEQELKTYEARLQCESVQFQNGYCSSYHLNFQKLLREKLSFEKCVDEQALPYYRYGGTYSSPMGVFFFEQGNTSIITNTTGTFLRDSINQEFDDLQARIEFLWKSTRDDMNAAITTQWSETRALDSATEEDMRALAHQEYQDTRDLVSASESGMRDYDESENSATRDEDSASESAMRDLTESSHQATRQHTTQEENSTRNVIDSDYASTNQLWTTETQTTISTISSASASARNAYKANENQEESATRLLVNQETADTIALERDSATLERSTYSVSQNTVDMGWNSLVSTISALATTFGNNRNKTESDTFINLLLHLELQSSSWNWDNGHNMVASFGPVDDFQRPDYIMKLRAVANDTIVFNNNRYGYSSLAQWNWVQAESYRVAGSYRVAAAYYQTAYTYAAST